MAAKPKASGKTALNQQASKKKKADLSTKSRLTPKQELFCREYMKDLNGAQAAIRAGYAKNSAKQCASEYLTKPYVAEFLGKLMAERVESVDYDSRKLLSDMVGVLQIAKAEVQAERGAQQINAFKGIADSVGKHVDISAFAENVKLTGDIVKSITCTLVRPKVDNRPPK